MRKLIAAVMLALGAIVSVPAQGADIPYYPPVEIPPVDYGLEGGFYLRGSAAANAWWAANGSYCGCVATFTTLGYGYSLGAGFGYETGDGLRADLTVDYLSNSGLTTTTGHRVNLRSGLVLANVYYDFGFADYGLSAAGGWGGYVGAGLGFAGNYSQITTGGGTEVAWGTSIEAAGAVMAGVTYDMGTMVADLGYRGIYMNKVMSQPPSVADTYIINNNFIHEVRGTVRYRLY